MRKDPFLSNWTTNNNGYALRDSEVARYIAVRPSENQLYLAEHPFYFFMHFGMNTACAREWGTGAETPAEFTIKKIKPDQWVKAVKAAGGSGLILTCKHHDGFCLWPSAYTSFSVANSDYDGDIVRAVSDACHAAGLDFGIYLSPWDMHEPTYGEAAYNDYFCNQLTELLTNYGSVAEVWFDGAKGANAKDFDYDWQRYFDLIRSLQPRANIAICGPDIRWVGNEGGKTRKSEFSVVPASLTNAEGTQKKSQHGEAQASSLQKLSSTDEDLGSRAVLAKNARLAWYPAEVDVSIRKGWFYKKRDNRTVKSGKRLFKLYLTSVGNNCTLLLNVPPTDKGTIHMKDLRALQTMGSLITEMTAHPIRIDRYGKLKDSDGYLEYHFDAVKKLQYVILQEDLRMSQRVEAFELWLLTPGGKWKKAFSGSVIGSKKIIALSGKKCVGARILIRQSRDTPYLKEIGFYE